MGSARRNCRPCQLNQIMAASLTVSVPIVVGFLLLQRFLVAGMTAGSVK